MRLRRLFTPRSLHRYTGALLADVGAAELGGAINFTTLTGRDADLFRARLDGGSCGDVGGQVSSGSVIRPLDYYVSVDVFTADNYQNYTASRARRVTANWGYQITPDIVSRFYFRYSYAYEEEAWGISKAQLRSNPSGGSARNILNQSQRINSGTYWIADRTDIRLDDRSSLGFGIDYHHYPINGPGAIFGTTSWAFNDLCVAAHDKREHTLFGSNSVSSVNLVAPEALNGQVWAYPDNGSIDLAYQNSSAQTRFTHSHEVNLDLSNELELAPKLWLSTALSSIETRRVNDFSVYPITGDLPKQNQSSVNWQGLIAARYDFSADVQVYAAVGRSVQAERAYDPLQFGGGYVTDPQLKNQTAVTYEIGTRATAGIVSGSFALYRKDILHELLGVKLHPTDIQATYTNSSPITHQGIELDLDTRLWQADGSLPEAPHRVVLRQAYAYSWLHYVDDPMFGHNLLPRIPQQCYQAEVQYQHGSGFNAGLNTQYSSSYYVDYANTYTNDAFTSWGAKLGYSRRGGTWDA